MTPGAQSAADAKKKLMDQQIIDPNAALPRLAVEPFTPYFRTNNFIQRTWTKVFAQGKPTVIEGQDVKIFAYSETVPAAGSTTVTLHTVPHGRRFILASSICSCRASLIQGVGIMVNGFEVTRVNFDTTLQVIDNIIGAFVLTEGNTLGKTLYNNDAVDRVMEGAMWGVEEDVNP